MSEFEKEALRSKHGENENVVHVDQEEGLQNAFGLILRDIGKSRPFL